jgi:hypothetical protein
MTLRRALYYSAFLTALLMASGAGFAEAWINVWTTHGPQNQA